MTKKFKEFLPHSISKQILAYFLLFSNFINFLMEILAFSGVCNIFIIIY